MAERVLRRYTKMPDEERDYYVDYADWFAGNPPESPARADAPASLTVTVPAGLTKLTDSLAGTKCMVKVAGGTRGKTYLIKFQLTTTAAPPVKRNAFIAVTIEEPVA